MTISFRSSSNALGSGAGVTLNLPSGTASGDIMIALFAMVVNGSGGPVNTLSGWTALPSWTSSYPDSFAFYRIAGGSEPSTYAWTVSDSDASDTSGAIVTYTGISPAIDVIASAASHSSSGTNAIAAITATQPGLLLLIAMQVMNPSPSLSTPAGFTQRLLVAPESLAQLGVYDKTSSAGSTGTVSQTGATYGISGFLVNLYDAASPSVTMLESGSVADTVGIQITYSRGVAESGNATDAQITAGTLLISESGNALDAATMGLIAAPAVNESGSATDGQTFAFTYGVGYQDPLQNWTPGSSNAADSLEGQEIYTYYEPNDGVASVGANTAPGYTRWNSVIANNSVGGSGGTWLAMQQGLFQLYTASGGGTAGSYAIGLEICLPAQVTASLSGTTLTVTAIAEGAVNNSQQIAVGGVSLAGPVEVTTVGTNHGTGTYTVLNPDGLSYPAGTAMTMSLQGGLQYNGQYYIGTGLGVPGDTGLFNDSLNQNPQWPSVMEMIGGGAFNMASVRLAPLPYYTTGYGQTTYVMLVGTLAAGGTVSQLATVTGPGFNIVSTPTMQNVTSVALYSTNAAGTQTSPGVPPYFMMAYFALTPVATVQDVPASGLTATPAVSESGSAADMPAASGGSASLTVAESGAAVDAATESMMAAPAVQESGSAVDVAVLASLGANLALTESGSVGDTPASNLSAARAVAEAGSVADTPGSTLSGAYSVTESGSSVDAPSSNLLAALNQAEAGNAVDAAAGSMSGAVGVAESGAVADSQSEALAAALTITESGAVSDIPAALLTIARTIAENGSVADAVNGAVVTLYAVIEAGSVADNAAQSYVGSVGLVESGAALDGISNGNTIAATISEAGSAVDVLAGLVTMLLAVAESGAAADAVLGTLVYVVSAVETGAAADVLGMVVTSNPAIAEVLAAMDYPSMSGGAAPFLMGNTEVFFIEAR